MGSHHAQADTGARDAGGDLGIVEGTVAAREIGDRVEFTCETDLLSEGGDAALELQQSHGDLPSVTGLADDVVGIGDRIVEEHLVEFRCAGELLDGPDGDAS